MHKDTSSISHEINKQSLTSNHLIEIGINWLSNLCNTSDYRRRKRRIDSTKYRNSLSLTLKEPSCGNTELDLDMEIDHTLNQKIKNKRQ